MANSSRDLFENLTFDDVAYAKSVLSETEVKLNRAKIGLIASAVVSVLSYLSFSGLFPKTLSDITIFIAMAGSIASYFISGGIGKAIKTALHIGFWGWLIVPFPIDLVTGFVSIVYSIGGFFFFPILIIVFIYFQAKKDHDAAAKYLSFYKPTSHTEESNAVDNNADTSISYNEDSTGSNIENPTQKENYSQKTIIVTAIIIVVLLIISLLFIRSFRNKSEEITSRETETLNDEDFERNTSEESNDTDKDADEATNSEAEIEIVDPFNGLELEFSGLEGNGTVALKRYPIDSIHYEVDNKEGLKTGDTITVRISDAEEYSEKYNVKFDPVTKGYEVPTLDSYIIGERDVTDEFITRAFSIGTPSVKDKVTSICNQAGRYKKLANYVDDVSLFWATSGLVNGEIENLKIIVGNSRKEGAGNIIFAVYKAPYELYIKSGSETRTGETIGEGYVFITVEYDNTLIMKDDFSLGNIVSTLFYYEADDINVEIETHRDEYTFTEYYPTSNDNISKDNISEDDTKDRSQDLQPVLDAYQQYVESQYYFPDSKFLLAYIDDDDIPELFVQFELEEHILRYLDGEVIDIGDGVGGTHFYFKPKKLDFIDVASDGESGFITYYKDFNIFTSDMENEYNLLSHDDLYNAEIVKIKSEYEDAGEDNMYDTLEEAIKNLK